VYHYTIQFGQVQHSGKTREAKIFTFFRQLSVAARYIFSLARLMHLINQPGPLKPKAEDIMRKPINTLIATLATTTTAFAANGATTEEPGMLAWAFLGFCAVILVGQMVPAAMLIIGAAKALITNPKEVKNH
jgi:hypothetical protein